jgi:hypothetical protein
MIKQMAPSVSRGHFLSSYVVPGKSKRVFECLHDFQEFWIDKFIENPGALSAAVQKTVAFQLFKLLRNIGLFGSEDFLDFADAPFAFGEYAEHSKSGNIRCHSQERDNSLALFDFGFGFGFHNNILLDIFRRRSAGWSVKEKIHVWPEECTMPP